MGLEPIAGAFEAENVGVVHDPVDHRGGDGLVAEHLAPTEVPIGSLRWFLPRSQWSAGLSCPAWDPAIRAVQESNMR